MMLMVMMHGEDDADEDDDEDEDDTDDDTDDDDDDDDAFVAYLIWTLVLMLGDLHSSTLFFDPRFRGDPVHLLSSSFFSFCESGQLIIIIIIIILFTSYREFLKQHLTQHQQ